MGWNERQDERRNERWKNCIQTHRTIEGILSQALKVLRRLRTTTTKTKSTTLCFLSLQDVQVRRTTQHNTTRTEDKSSVIVTSVLSCEGQHHHKCPRRKEERKVRDFPTSRRRRLGGLVDHESHEDHESHNSVFGTSDVRNGTNEENNNDDDDDDNNNSVVESQEVSSSEPASPSPDTCCHDTGDDNEV